MAENPDQLHELILRLYEIVNEENPDEEPYKPETAQDFGANAWVELVREEHALFQYGFFERFPKGLMSQDGGQPWFLFWLTNALEVCNQREFVLTSDMKKRCCSYLRQCWNEKEGGFAGAPYLQVHIASNYAAMLAIVNIGTEEAFKIVDPIKMRACLNRLKNNMDIEYNQSSQNSWVFQHKTTKEVLTSTKTSEVVSTLPGSISIHKNGEMDIRGVYCSLVVADILNILEGNQELTRGCGDFVASCQTYEGGISCAPFGEAHGGYTFCGLAALLLLKESEKLDLERCLDWLTQRQISSEGGFNGRINKLVDSCYNFWQGATFELLDIAMNGNCNVDGEWLFNQNALQGYTIFCCQNSSGGLKDKPTKGPDPYHTVYSLLGCSIAQHKSDFTQLYAKTPEAQSFREKFDGNYSNLEGDDEADFQKTSLLAGVLDNKLRRMHPIHSVRFDLLEKAKKFYRQIDQ